MRIARKIRLSFLLLVLAFVVLAALRSYFPEGVRPPFLKHHANNNSFKIGEEVRYRIEWKRFKIGSFTLKFIGNAVLNEKRVDVITSSTKVMNFTDFEKIYADPETYYPIRVEREFTRFGIKTKVVEEYDQDNNTVRITQYDKRRTKERVISNKLRMQNAVLLIYKCRRLKEYKIGETFPVTLPTTEFKMKLSRIEQIKVPLGIYKAYLFESVPGNIKLWLSVDKKTPLRIDRSSFMGYSMAVEEIKVGT